jgi:glycerol-3-phosphate O-acyltransferase
VCQAVFLEGGLTRDGRLREPRLGFLDYMMRDYHLDVDRDVVFVPVGINYDRVIEDRTLLRKLDKSAEKRSTWFVLKTSVRFFIKTALLQRKERWRRFGYASVNFGEPVSAKAYCRQFNIDFSQMDDELRFQWTKRLADELMHKISDVIPVLPAVLMSEVVLAHKDEWKTELELKAEAMGRIGELEKLGAPIKISGSACENVLSAALRMLAGRGFVEQSDEGYRASENAIEVLSYYANSIAHWNKN